ncbi:GNAT family N-acetyltransferase [Jiulongibacter sediminis]|uniref:Acetyltransferase n=1 Tax=Jiulongibacter sediminis TaxID=1605367 RepID=A0A0P7C4R6_9BACT|nr:GNAT family N-acetyltransferase [Jiulongibacter sediminis]KPM48254.1 acetyltransferase [Jiulongibacter sediminis]TBX24796.1 acetyltransferase [Jiulongibacter sediminis]
MDLTIREARPDELPELKGFEQEIIKAERPFDSTLAPDPISYYNLAELMAAEDSIVIIAEAEGQLVGSGFAQIRKPKNYYTYSVYTHLGFMFVDPRFRGMGVNARIIEALTAWSKERGVDEIRLTVYPDNAAAIKAYEKVGFKSQLVEMRLNLKG